MASITSPAAAAAAPASLRSSLCSEFLRTLVERGFLHQCTDLDALDAAAASAPVRGYIGFDATAGSLHVGSLIQIMMLRHMQRSGHHPIVLMGGGTTRVGDPSGKDRSRQLLSDEQIATNIAGIRRVFERYIEFGDISAVSVCVVSSWNVTKTFFFEESQIVIAASMRAVQRIIGVQRTHAVGSLGILFSQFIESPT